MTETLHQEYQPAPEEYDQTPAVGDGLPGEPHTDMYDAAPQADVDPGADMPAGEDPAEQASRWSRLRESARNIELGDRLKRVVVGIGAGALEGAGVLRQDEAGQLRAVSIAEAVDTVAELRTDPRGAGAALAQRAVQGARSGGRRALKAEAGRAWADLQRAA